MRVECCICYEKTRDLGELDACLHRFCFECISRWAETENRCPMCKERFIVIKRKHLPRAGGSGNAGASTKSSSYRPVGVKRSREQAADTDAAHVPSDGSNDDEDPDLGDGPRKRLKGTVIETRIVPDRTQTWQPAELLTLNLDSLRCQVCRRGDDDERLLLCDGCDRGFHTYCVHLDDIPQGEWYCPECEEHRATLLFARGRRPRVARGRAGRGRVSAAATASAAAGPGRRGGARGRRGSRSRRGAAAAPSAATTADVISDVDSGVVTVADSSTGGSNGSHDSGYETIGSDAEDQEGPVLALHSDRGENDEEGAEEYEYDDNGSGEEGDDGDLDDGSDQGEDLEGEAADGTGAYADADGSRSGGGGGVTTRRRSRRSNRSRGRGRGRGRSRRRRTSTAGGRSSRGSRRGPSRAVLRERLGTAARARAFTAAQGQDSAAAAAAAAAAAGDLEEVPLAQRRTVARARLYADQLRVEMMRRNWTALRGAEAQEFGQSTLGAEYRRLQQEQGAAAAAVGSNGASSSAATAARERALQALRAQRAQEAAAAATLAAGRGASSGRRRTENPDASAGLPLFVSGAYGSAYATASEDDELAGAWRSLSRLRDASGAVASAAAASGTGRRGLGSGASGAAVSGNSNVPARLGGPPLGPSPLELLRSSGPGALVGGFTRPQRPPAAILAQSANSNGLAEGAGQAQVARSASPGPRLPLSALIPGLARSPARPPARHGVGGPEDGLGGDHSAARNGGVPARASSGGGERCGLSGRAAGGTAASRGIVIFSSDERQDNHEAGDRSLPQPLPLQSQRLHQPPPLPPQQLQQQQQHYSSLSSYLPASTTAETSAAAFHTTDTDAHFVRFSPSQQSSRLHLPPSPPRLLPPARAANVVLPSLATQQPANATASPPPPASPLPTLSDELPCEARLQHPCSASHQWPSPSAPSHGGLEPGEICHAMLDSDALLQVHVRTGMSSEGAAVAGSRGNSGGSREVAAVAMEVDPSGRNSGGLTRSHHHHKHRHREKHRHDHRDAASHRLLDGQERRHHHRHHPREERRGDLDLREPDQDGEAHRYRREDRSYNRRQRRRSTSEEGEVDSDNARAEAGASVPGAQVEKCGPGAVVNRCEGAGPQELAARDSSRKAVKLAACEAVKALLTPLYSQRLLGKEAFKEAAKAATAALRMDMAAAGLGPEDLRKEAVSVARSGNSGAASGDRTGADLATAALARTLQGMGLGHLMGIVAGPHVAGLER